MGLSSGSGASYRRAGWIAAARRREPARNAPPEYPSTEKEEERGEEMTKELRCADLGMNCGHVMKGDSDEEVLKQAEDHARKAHRLVTFDEKMKAKVTEAIRLSPFGS
jgi:predicted small metal-binding protein